METQRLYRSKTDRMIGGVCGGLGGYFNIDPTLVRLIFVVLTIMGGGGVLIYFILWIVIPEEGRVAGTPQEIMRDNAQEMGTRARELGQGFEQGFKSRNAAASRQGALIFGLVLVVLGGLFLLQNLNIFRINFNLFWPLVLIVIGVAMLLPQFRKPGA
jgi:phage shock protein C